MGVYMKNYSIWKNNLNKRQYDKLTNNLEVDVLIIGGGITGISTLYHLRHSNLKVVLVDQNRIGLSVTANSTGKLTYLQNDLLDKIRKSYDDNIASRYLNSQREAISSIVSTIKEENIDCDLKKTSSCLYTNNEKEIPKIKELKTFLEKNSIKVKEKTSKLVHSKYMIEVDDTYIFHPIKFVQSLGDTEKFQIYEETSIKKIEEKDNLFLCHTDKNTIDAKWVVLASHFPYFLVPQFFPLKGYLEKSYLSASINKTKDKNVSLISYSNPFISIRTYQNYLIYLSNSHSTNMNLCDRENFMKLMTKLHDIKLEPDYLWSNIDIITNDGLPYIGSIKNNLLIGTGYNTWGLTNGFLAGKTLSDIVLGKKNQYIDLFSPTRINKSQVLGGITNIYKNIDGFIKSYLYKDSSKINKICPHLGCKLIWNDIENTWDCPCHGSRFDKEGKCISGPSKDNIY